MTKLSMNAGSFCFEKNRVLFENLNISIGGGEIVSVLGPNGAGKTTFLRCLLGFLKLKDGSVCLNDRDIRKIGPKAFFKKIAYVPQKKAAALSYTVAEEVLLGRSTDLNAFETPKKEDLLKVEEVLRFLEIYDLKDQPLDKLSGGELQMVLIARALVSDPDILVLDEPESGLDFKNQLKVLNVMEELKARGLSCIFNTHYPEHALQHSDYALMLGEGRHLFGKTEEVITEENIRHFFGVEVEIISVTHENHDVKSVIPINIIPKE